MNRFYLPAAILFWALLSIVSGAFGETKTASRRLYGWELEFTNPKVFNADYGKANAHANDINDAAREKWKTVVQKRCAQLGNCRIKKIEDWVGWYTKDGDTVWSWETASYRVVYNDGFWFQLSYDPGVVEVQLKPLTPSQVHANAARLQTDIFDTAKAAGLKPKARPAETHIHIGAQAAFNLDVKQIRDFLADGVSHPEWPLLFASGLHNAPPLILLPKRKYTTMGETFEAVDHDELSELNDFVKVIRHNVYDVTYDEDMVGDEEDTDPAQKFQQWNIERLRKKFADGEKTIEHRAMPAPQNAEDVVDLTDLVDARIEYLKRRGKPITLAPYKAKLSRAEQVALFQAYVEESGLQIDRYRRFLPKSCERYLTK